MRDELTSLYRSIQARDLFELYVAIEKGDAVLWTDKIETPAATSWLPRLRVLIDWIRKAPL